MFTSNVYKFYTNSNFIPGRHIGTVKASDADKGLNAMIQYSIDGESDDELIINPTTGEISRSHQKSPSALERILQFEKRVELSVIAKDYGVPPKWSKAALVLLINDKSWPEMLSEVHENANLTEVVAEMNAPLGTIVCRTSSLLGKHSKQWANYRNVSYSIVPSNNSTVSIDQHGDISLTATLQVSPFHVYVLAVSTENSYNHSLMLPVKLVTPEPVTQPVFKYESVVCTLSKKTANGTIIGKLEATRSASHFYLEDQPAFTINKTSGQIRLADHRHISDVNMMWAIVRDRKSNRTTPSR